jgi:4-hydroxy-3-polyprenylbenzoate decarboxylase
VRIFVGITGASGAPYTARLLEALAGAGCEVGVAASSAAEQVFATELGEPVADVVARYGARLYAVDDWSAPYASGSARVDGYVVCPCSMGTLGAVAAGAMQNLIHRAASVALKEGRKLVLMPRETPLSTIHLENMLTLRRAGATILFLAPGFYHAPQSIADLVDFVVARALDQLGLENSLSGRWGS